MRRGICLFLNNNLFQIRRDCKRQQFWLTLNLYASGLRGNTHRQLRALSQQLLPTSTFYRHLRLETERYALNIKQILQTTSTNQVHWIDNFARHFAMHGIHLGTLLDLLSCCLLGKELFKKKLWTAHGVKLIPANVKMAHVMKGSNASPPFPPLVSDDALTRLYNRLAKINHYQYAKSECVLRDVRRVPLKPEGADAEEVKHLALSSDGLRFFHPVSLYSHNCQSSDGLVAVLRELSKLSTFINPSCKSYSVISVDVSLYNMLMHLCIVSLVCR